MNGNNKDTNEISVDKNTDTQQMDVTESLIGRIALTNPQDAISSELSERIELAKSLVSEIRQICEDDLVFNELVLRGIDDREDDDKSHIELVWSGNPFPLYAQRRTVSYVDAKGMETPLQIAVVGMGSYAVKADAWPPTNGDAKKEDRKLTFFKKKIAKSGFWGLHISIGLADNPDDTEDVTVSTRSTDSQSIFTSADAQDIAQLQILANLIKQSTRI